MPTLALGQAATWLLERECEALSTLPDIENGRLLWVESVASEGIAWPSAFHAGAYGKRLQFSAGAEPGPRGDWQCIQKAGDGEWVAAINPKTRTAALCFRPESVLSEIGARQTLMTSLQWLRALA